MKIGFIGAGKVGCTLGKYFTVSEGCKGTGSTGPCFEVTGYYSKTAESARKAAEFTDTEFFSSLEQLVKVSDAIFLTVPDGAIKDVWEQIKAYDLTDKVICHTSGAMSSDVFEGIAAKGAYGYSIHPLFAVFSRLESYKDISRSFITVEGHEKYQDFFVDAFRAMGHKVAVIHADQKTRYHAAAVYASNLVVGLVGCAQEILVSCGFEPEDAGTALMPLFMNNCENIEANGVYDALTGPIERNDIGTITKHLDSLSGNEEDVYVALSREVLKIAKVKNPERDYGHLADFLEERKK